MLHQYSRYGSRPAESMVNFGVAGRRGTRKAATAGSLEDVRGDHEPGPFVANAPRNAAVTVVPAKDRKVRPIVVPCRAAVSAVSTGLISGFHMQRLTLPTILTLLRLTALPIIVAGDLLSVSALDRSSSPACRSLNMCRCCSVVQEARAFWCSCSKRLPGSCSHRLFRRLCGPENGGFLSAASTCGC